MAEVYTGGDRSLQALLKSHDDRLRELEKPGAGDVQRVTVKVVEAKQTAEAADAAAAQAQLDALAAQTDALTAKADALEAAANALQAALDAANAQQATVNLRESIAQPGVNKFDTAPIVAQNIAGYYTENLTGYSWLTGGIRLQTPEATAVGVRVYTMDAFAVRPGDVLSASVTLTFDNPAVAGFGWSFFDADGAPISSSASSIATENGLLQSQYPVPSNAASLRMNLFAYVPSGYSVTRTWVEFRNPFVGILVGSDGLAKEAVKRVNIAPGAVGANELDPGLSFGVPDDSLTTAKYQNLSVTDPKIAGMSVSKLIGQITNAMIAAVDAAKLTGTILLARLPASITGRTEVGASTVSTDNVTSGNGREMVPGILSISNLRSNNVSTFTETIGSAIWWAMTIPTAALASHVTTVNTIAGCTISGKRIYVPSAGTWEVDANVVFGNATGGTARSAAFSVNGGSLVWESANRMPSYVNAVLLMSVRAKLVIPAGGYFEVHMRQDTGGNLGLCRIEDLTMKFIGSA